MKHYPVRAEFVDRATGKRHYPGGTFAPRDSAQLERLINAGCLGKEPVVAVDKPIVEMGRRELEAAAIDAFTEQLAKASDEDLRSGLERFRAGGELAGSVDGEGEGESDNDDGLDANTVDELKKIAEGETIDLGGATKKADIVAAIRAARAQNVD